jgi:nucleoside-diphosphate-sugar epimerase
VDIFYQAKMNKEYTCFLRDDSALPMMYMADAIRATIELMEAPAEKVRVRSSYNLSGCSFTPAELTAAIQTHLPAFNVRYVPDFRQQIADSWPASIDDSAARSDWGWKEQYGTAEMVQIMLDNVDPSKLN